MSTILILLGSEIYLNRALVQALQRKIEAKNRPITTIHTIESIDPVSIKRLQDILGGSGDFCIAASTETYPVVSKIVAAMADETIHPANTTQIQKDSLLLRINENECNLLFVKSGDPIPEILLDAGKQLSVWQLFGNEEHLHALKQHAAEKHYHFEFFSPVEGWYEIHTEAAYRIDNILPFSDDTILLPSDNIFDTCIEVLSSNGETISFAESCTGGLIAASFTSKSGSSNILNGSVVSYANRIKHRWLDVDESILENPGAVSSECVKEMAEGARKLARSDIALATSGIAGPTGGTPLKPVGTVYVAYADGEESVTEHLFLKGDRNYIQYQAMMHVVKLMIGKKKKNFEKFFKIS